MTPPSTATARGATARPSPRSAPGEARRPPLRVFEPAPRRRPTGRGGHRTTLWVSCLLIVGSLFAVVVGDDVIAQGQVTLSSTQASVAAAITTQKSLQVAVASKAAPPLVVKEAEAQGLVAPTQVVDLPRVPLNVPLPAPHTTPAPATTPTAPAPAPITAQTGE